MFVDRQGVTAMSNQRRRAHVVMEGKSTLHTRDRQRVPPNCTDRVVHTEIRDLHAPRPANEEFLRVVQIRHTQAGHPIRAACGIGFLAVDEPRIPHEFREASKFRSAVAEERRQRAGVMLALTSEEAVVLPELRDGEWSAAS
jgi:hypothetical protein